MACSKKAVPSTPSSLNSPLSRPLEHLVLVGIRQFVERLASELRLATPVQRGEPFAVLLRGAFFRLVALALGSLQKGRTNVETVLTSIRAGKLAIDEYGAAGILSAGRFGVGRNDAVGKRLDRPAFVAGEEEPGSKRCGGWGIASVGCPWKVIENNGRAGT